MRALFLLAVLLIAAPVSSALAFHAGITRLTVPGTAPFDALVWYPTDTTETPWETGSWPIPATHDAPIAPGPFPVVLLSHGGGVGGGNPLILCELSSRLAQQGFVVIAPFHGTTHLLQRPFQVLSALDAVTADPRFKSHLDPAHLGMIGFSLGTAVTLELAGGVPDFAHLDAYCDAHPSDAMSCDHAPGGGGRRTAVPPGVRLPLPPPLSLKAIVLLDPFGALFPRDHLTAVTMPVLLFRPDHSELPGEENTVGLAAALPRPPQLQTIPGGHFIFVDVCPPRLQAAAPEACRDPPGVDRSAIHAAVEAQIVRFLAQNL